MNPTLAAVVIACAAMPAKDPALLGPVTAFAMLEDATFACSQAGVARVDADGARLVLDPGFRITALAADPADGSLLAAGGVPGEAGIVARVRDGAVCAKVEVAEDLVSAIAIDPSDRTVLAGCDDGRVLALAPDTLAVVAVLRRHTAPVRALAQHGALLASAGLDGNVMLGPRDAAPRVLRDHTAGVECAVWSRDGAVLASGSRDGRVRFHDASGRLLRSVDPLRTRVACIAALPDGRFAFGTDDGRVLATTAAPTAELDELARLQGPAYALCRDADALWIGCRAGVTRVAVR